MTSLKHKYRPIWIGGDSLLWRFGTHPDTKRDQLVLCALWVLRSSSRGTRSTSLNSSELNVIHTRGYDQCFHYKRTFDVLRGTRI